MPGEALRFNQDVRAMGEAAKFRMGLRPITFNYKRQPGDPLQVGSRSARTVVLEVNDLDSELNPIRSGRGGA